MPVARERLLLCGITALFCARTLLALLTIPPWQNPDEAQNLAFVRLLQHDAGAHPIDDLVLRHRGGLRDDPDSEPLILASMAKYGWWTHYGLATPNPPPRSFRAVDQVVGADFGLPGGPAMYFVACGRMLNAVGIRQPAAQVMMLRVVSGVFGVLTLLCGWAGSRLFFGSIAGMGTALLLSLHPQFLLVSNTANADAVVNFWGGVAWWQTARLFARPRAGLSLAAMFGAAAFAAATKRLGMPLLVAVCGSAVAWIWGARSRISPRLALTGIAVPAAAVVAAAVAFPTELARIRSSASFVDERWHLDLSLDWIWRFSKVLFESTWLTAGWMRYPIGPGWVIAWLVVVTASAIGLVRAWPTLEIPIRRGIVVATLFVGAQIAAVYAVHFPIGSGPGGRYLFPAVGPLLALVWVGWESLAPRGDDRWAMALVLFAFVFDVAGWATVFIPVYVR
jgi:hypothetical protein